MTITNSFKLDLRINRLIGRGKFDTAISIAEGALDGTDDDVFRLSLIARLYYEMDRNLKALEYANRVIEIDETDFYANALLAQIYAQREEPELAVGYIQIALNSFPDPLPGVPRYVFKMLDVLEFSSRRLARQIKSVRADIEDPNRTNQEWLTWATAYQRHYYGAYGNAVGPETR